MDEFENYTCNGKGCQTKSSCKRYTEWVKAFQEDRVVEEFETAPFGFNPRPKNGAEQTQHCLYKK